jgi:hypothetical protein
MIDEHTDDSCLLPCDAASHTVRRHISGFCVQIVANSDKVARWIDKRELAHSPRLVSRCCKPRYAFHGKVQPRELVVELVRISNTPVGYARARWALNVQSASQLL